MEFKRKEESKINIVPKETSKFHAEQIAKVFSVKEKRIPFTHQETPANCGPLAIVNGLRALAEVNKKFNLPKDFPLSSKGIRELLAKEEVLRKSYKGTEHDEEIKKDTYALQGEHLSNILKKISQEANIVIRVDRFSNPIFISPEDLAERVKNSDWILSHKDYHYTSFIKLDGDTWVSLDSMSDRPTEVSQNFIEGSFKDVLPKVMPMFVALKVEDKPKINIIKK